MKINDAELESTANKIKNHNNPTGGFAHEMNTLKGRIAAAQSELSILKEGETMAILQKRLLDLWNLFPEYQQGYLETMRQMQEFSDSQDNG